MFRRKLAALGYPKPINLDVSDELQFRNLIIWLEDQKIRHYLIENRTDLKNVQSKTWDKTFEIYLRDLHYPFVESDRQAIVEWLLSLAVRLEYGDDVGGYQDITGKLVHEKRTTSQSSAIHNIKDTDLKFKEAVRNLAKVLSIQLHEDDRITLEAVVLFVEERLSEKGLANFTKKSTKNSVPLQQQELGFDTKDETLNNAARALRLLHINELRQLQTDINNAIVSVQSMTANPKTDQRLGRVGRG